MIAAGANFRSLRSLMDISAVAALPAQGGVTLEGLVVLVAVKKL